MTARNLALEALKELVSNFGEEHSGKFYEGCCALCIAIERANAAISALEAETGEPVAVGMVCNNESAKFLAYESMPKLNGWVEVFIAQPPAVPQWLPIESAPKNGTSVLVISKGVLWPSVAYFCNNHWYWSTSAGWAGFPTHWMPLPAAPGAPA